MRIQAFTVVQVVGNMSQQSSSRTPRRGRVFPERQLSPEEKAQRKAEWEEFNQRCQIIFKRIQPELYMFRSMFHRMALFFLHARLKTSQ